MINGSDKNPNRITKILLYSFENPAGSWTADGDDWYRWALPVYRMPQGSWDETEGFTRQKIWFIEKLVSASAIDPNDINFPPWFQCNWDSQAGRWVIISPGGPGGVIEYKIVSTSIKTTGPYTGLKAASVIVHGAPCSRPGLIGTTVEVIDHSANLFDETSMVGYTGWASEMVFLSLDPEVECDTISPCHWAAINRVCTAATGIYASPCEAATYYVPDGYAPAGYMPVGYV